MRDVLLQLGFLLVASGGLVLGWALVTGQLERPERPPPPEEEEDDAAGPVPGPARPPR